MPRTERRLAAILAADVAGYSRHVGRDELGTIQALKGHLSAIGPVVGLHAGRIVKTMGDGLLAEFPSISDAVSCAAMIQRRIAERNSDQPAERRLEFRIGVHSGEVVVDGADILGEGVNIAARLQAVAEPGGVVISGRVHDEAADHTGLPFEDLGMRDLRHIARPVRVYALRAEAPPAARAPLALPDKPSLAVLPFLNLAPDSAREYLADGLTEDIITALACIPWLFVIARNSSFAYKGLAVDVRKLGRELGVRYVLEGSMRHAGERLRITAQLVDAGSGAHIWAERYDGAMAEIFELQDRITEAVAAAIAPEIRRVEIERARLKQPGSLDAYDNYLRALDAVNRVQIREAEAFLDGAIAAAADYPLARALKAWCLSLGPWRGRATTPATAAAALALAEAALASAASDPEVDAYAGYVMGCFGDADTRARGLMLVERTATLCPSLSFAWTSAALLHAYAARPAEAIERAERALRLSPRDPLAFRTYLALCVAHQAAGVPERVLHYAALGLELSPRTLVLLRYRIVALVRLGRMEEARAEALRHMKQAPEFRVGAYVAAIRDVMHFAEALWAPTAEALRRAGIPD